MCLFEHFFGATPSFQSCEPCLLISLVLLSDIGSLIIVQLTFAPKSTYERQHSKVSTNTRDEEVAEGTAPEPEVEGSGDRIVGVMFGKTASEQIFSLWWL